MDGKTPNPETPRILNDMLADCRICPRDCGADRSAGETGYCGIAESALVSSFGRHLGEEPPLVGRRGSGAIFFAGCNLQCVFCQNYEISRLRAGGPAGERKLAEIMLDLQSMGCHNINFVSPTHVIPQVINALEAARGAGLNLPTVYNSGGYDKAETLRLLEGWIDIYMPDAKYLDADAARKFSDAPDYPQVMKSAIGEMQRQVGDLAIRDGVAERGLLIRHLVMPGMLDDSRRIIDFVADEISPNAYINVMEQYRPCYRANEYPELSTHPEPRDIADARRHALERGLRLSD